MDRLPNLETPAPELLDIVTPPLVIKRCVKLTAPEFVRIRTEPCCDRCGDFEPCNCDPRLLRQFWERG